MPIRVRSSRFETLMRAITVDFIAADDYPPRVSSILSWPLQDGQPRGFPPNLSSLISGDLALSPPYLDVYIWPLAATAVGSQLHHLISINR